MPTNVDLAAVVIMESLGATSFLVGLMLLRQYQRISAKRRLYLDALSKQLISERGDGKCFSSEWALDNIVHTPRKLLSATPLFFTALTFLLAIFMYGVGPRLLANIVSFGYAALIALFGIAIILWTDAFQAYSYTNAILKVSSDKLDKEDLSYIELAREALAKAFLRFASVGIAFSVSGPFIPQAFNSIVYVFTSYATVFFQASEASFNVSTVLGALIVLIFPMLMFLLPELLGRFIIRRGKFFARKLLKRNVEQ